MVWDLFCRVVDNFGDIGVCWRLACDLATRGESVRLWTSDRSALDWMAPGGHVGVDVSAWDESAALREVGEVVIEAFGCELPEGFVVAMARRRPPPVWVNLEHLSAENHAVRNHGLPSPRWAGPGAGLTKWFFYPGFEAGTGGLIHEIDLDARRARFDPVAWLGSMGLRRSGAERVVSLFCYDRSNIPALIESLAAEPTLILATAGTAAYQVEAALGSTLRQQSLRAAVLPRLSQIDYDHLLWSCDLNFVRGEDSWVRAQWAGRPFIWQAYRQDDGAQHAKVDAFLNKFLAGAPNDLSAPLRKSWLRWNAASFEVLDLPDLDEWRRHADRWRRSLSRQPDLGGQLLGFAREKR